MKKGSTDDWDKIQGDDGDDNWQDNDNVGADEWKHPPSSCKAKQSRPFVTQETEIPAPSGYYRPARVVLGLKGLKYELITLFGKSHTSLMTKL